MKLAQPPSTTILISSVPPPIRMFLGQFGAADCVPRISFPKFDREHGEISISNVEFRCEVSTTTSTTI